MTNSIWLRGYVRGLDASPSNAGIGSRFSWTKLELGADASFDAQLVSFGEINEKNNPYFAILGKSLPFVRMQANIWKDFSTSVGVYGIHLGWNGRLLTEDDPAPFNRWIISR